MKRPCFTKLAVSQLIMVRFWKFKICDTQQSDTVLTGHNMTSRDVTRARTRTSQPQSESGCCTVAMRSYLLNREVDFANFLHANWYGGVGSIVKKSALLDQYLSRERISWFPWQPFWIFKFRFREVFFVPLPDHPAEFGARRSINRGGDGAQTNNVTLLKL